MAPSSQNTGNTGNITPGQGVQKPRFKSRGEVHFVLWSDVGSNIQKAKKDLDSTAKTECITEQVSSRNQDLIKKLNVKQVETFFGHKFGNDEIFVRGSCAKDVDHF